MKHAHFYRSCGKSYSRFYATTIEVVTKKGIVYNKSDLHATDFVKRKF